MSVRSRGVKKAFTSGRIRPISPAEIAALPVSLGMGADLAPNPPEESRRLENRRGTTTRLRETIGLMNKRRV